MSTLEFGNLIAQIAHFYAAALDRNDAVAIWRQPGAALPAALAAHAAERISRVDLAQDRPGFVLAPFAEERRSLFLPAHALLLPDSPRQPQPAAASTAGRWYAAPDAADAALDARAYTALVADAVRFIRSAHIAKVVVARTAPVALPAGFDPLALFAALCTRYPNAFISLVGVPGVGTWLGASPELLLRTDARTLTTVALAGTQPRAGDQPLAPVYWGNKERAEQEMVSAYIRSSFAAAGATEVREQGPVTVAAGGVVHLQTTFSTATDPAHLPALANRVLARLHPTSAVCGMPRNEALQFIQAREGYDRGFYSGYLGPLQIAGESALYVNLRCVQLRAAGAALYVGAGITADSDPAAEWRETELKTRTVLDALADAAAPLPAPALELA